MIATRFTLLQQSQAERSINMDESAVPKCLVSPEGGVNCSETVYQDPVEWRTSRRQIEQQIRAMRIQLETLKVSSITGTGPVLHPNPGDCHLGHYRASRTDSNQTSGSDGCSVFRQERCGVQRCVIKGLVGIRMS